MIYSKGLWCFKTPIFYILPPPPNPKIIPTALNCIKCSDSISCSSFMFHKLESAYGEIANGIIKQMHY